MTTLEDLAVELQDYALEPHNSKAQSFQLRIALQNISKYLKTSTLTDDDVEHLDSVARSIACCACACRQRQTSLARGTLQLLRQVAAAWPKESISKLVTGFKSSLTVSRSASSAQTVLKVIAAIVDNCQGDELPLSDVVSLMSFTLHRIFVQLNGKADARSRRIRARTIDVLRVLSVKCVGLPTELVKYAAGKEQTGTIEFCLLAIQPASGSAEPNSTMSQEIVALALDVFKKVGFENKKLPSSDTLDGFKTTVARATSEQLNNLLETVNRALKLNTETKISSAIFLFSHITVDISESVVADMSMITVALKSITSAKSHVSLAGMQLLSALQQACTQSNVLTLLVKETLGVLAGTGPSGKTAVSQPTQRMAVIKTLNILADALSNYQLFNKSRSTNLSKQFAATVPKQTATTNSDVAELAHLAGDALATLAKSERNEDCKTLAMLAAVQWTTLVDECGDEVASQQSSEFPQVLLNTIPTSFAKAAAASTAAKVSGEVVAVVQMLELLCRSSSSPRRASIAAWLADTKQKDVVAALVKLSLCISSASANLFATSAPSNAAVQQALSAYYVLFVCASKEDSLAQLSDVEEVLAFYSKSKYQPAHNHIIAAVSAAAGENTCPEIGQRVASSNATSHWTATMSGVGPSESVCLTAASIALEAAQHTQSAKYAIKVKFAAQLVACAMCSDSVVTRARVSEICNEAIASTAEPQILCMLIAESLKTSFAQFSRIVASTEQQRLNVLQPSSDDSDSTRESQRLVPSPVALQHAILSTASAAAKCEPNARTVLALMVCAMHPLASQGTEIGKLLAHDQVLYKRTSRAMYHELARTHLRHISGPSRAFTHKVARALLSNQDEVPNSVSQARHALLKVCSQDPAASELIMNELFNKTTTEGEGESNTELNCNRVALHRAAAWLLLASPSSDGLFGSSNGSLNQVAVHWKSILCNAVENQPTDDDMKIWQTPDDQVCELESEEAAQNDNKSNSGIPAAKLKQGRKGRGGTRKELYSVEGDEWERKVRAELEAKKKSSTSTSSTSKSNNSGAKVDPKLLAKQQGIRARIDEQFSTVSNVLQTIQMLLKISAVVAPRNDSLSFRELIDLSSAVTPLLSSPLFGEEAILTLQMILEYDPAFSRTNCAPGSTFELACATQLATCVSANTTSKANTKANKASLVLCKNVNLITSCIATIMQVVRANNPAFDPIDSSTCMELTSSSIAILLSVVRLVLLGSTTAKFQELVATRESAAAAKDEELQDAAQDDGADLIATIDPISMLVDQAFAILTVHTPMLGASSSFPGSTYRALALEALLVVAADEQLGGAGGGNVPWTRPATNDVITALCQENTTVALSDTEINMLVNDLGVLNELAPVRACSLSALLEFHSHTPLFNKKATESDSTESLLISRIWFACCDSNEQVNAIADDLVDATDIEFPSNYAENLLELLKHPLQQIRAQAGRTLSTGVEEYPESAQDIVQRLEEMYKRAASKEAEIERQLADKKNTFFFDEDAEKMAKDEEAHALLWRGKSGVALALEALATPEAADAPPAIPESLALRVFTFILDHGLKDSHPQVRDEMLRANIALVDSHGKSMIKQFLGLLDVHLDESKSGTSNDITQDWQREGAVVCLGALAKHLDSGDSQIPRVVDILVEALKTPSEPVQMAVTRCLPPLMKSPQLKEKETAGELLTRVLDRAFDPNGGYAERRGAAMGVAGMVKGLGIGSLKQHQVVTRLEEAGKSKSGESRQGALMTFEMLCGTLGMLFEPYVITILPMLLQAFSDKETQVRESAHEAAKIVMGKLSGHGVKLVLPTLLESIEDPAWRTKQAAIQLLGSMAYCAPKQLASCLPQIVPRLVQAFSDTKAQVREAGKQALDDIGSVIKNPEILTLVPTLMGALVDPHKKTHQAVDTLHRTRFVHMVDAPSLALMVPVLHRGLKERSTDTKKKAALIVGNMCSMIADPKAVQPYVDNLIPILKNVLVDPIPGVRSTAAKAFGTLTKGLGENLPDFAQLLQWMIDTMRGNTSGVERSGGAQGLVEVLVALGNPRMDEILHEHVFGLSSHALPCVREGVVWVLVFMPPVLKRDGNAPYIHEELTIILRGLSDEAEPVRDVSMRAGQVLVTQHAISHTSELLPALEGGLANPGWRIRQSSLHLLGDLLFKVGGAHAAGVVVANTSVLAEDEGDDDVSDSEDSGDEDGEAIDLSALTTVELAIVNSLGKQSRDRILARLYMMRSDVSAVVRQSALKVWKSIVGNTPRTLRQIMPVLMGQIISALSGDDENQQIVAGRTLGDVVRKLGERVLPDIVPTIQTGLEVEGVALDDDPTKSQDQEEEDLELPVGTNELERVGVALGLRQVVVSAPKKQLAEYIPLLLPSIMQAVCDPSPRVREHAAVAYNLVHKAAGERVVGEVIPSLLGTVAEYGLNSRRGQKALVGLREIVALRGRDVLPMLLPKLLVTPLTRSNALALGAVAEVTGDMLHYHVENIYAIVLQDLGTTDLTTNDTSEISRVEAIREAAVKVVSSVSSAGIQVALSYLLEYLQERNSPQIRAAAAEMVAGFCANSNADFEDQVPLLLKELIRRLGDVDEMALKSAWNALNALCTRVPAAELSTHINFVRDAIQNTASAAKHRKGTSKVDEQGNFVLAGFCLPKGISPLLPMYQHALMNGDGDVRSSAAEGLEEIISLTEASALRPFVVKITGPLIRIVGDRFSAQVKAAILSTLHTLLAKAGPFLRPFLPQLQTTFVKALNSESQLVRDRSEKALGKLIAHSTRVDPLVNELGSGAFGNREGTTEGVQVSMLSSLAAVLKQCGAKVSASSRMELLTGVSSMLQEDLSSNARVRAKASLCCARLISQLDEVGDRHAELNRIVFHSLNGYSELDDNHRHSLAILLSCVLQEVSAEDIGAVCENQQLLKFCNQVAQDPKVPVQEAAGRLVASAIGMHLKNGVAVTAAPVVNCGKILQQLMGAATEEVRSCALEALGVLSTWEGLHEVVFQLVKSNSNLASAAIACTTADKSSVVRAAGEVAWYQLLRIGEHGTDSPHLKEFVASPPGGSKDLAKSVSDLARKTLSKMDL